MATRATVFERSTGGEEALSCFLPPDQWQQQLQFRPARMTGESQTQGKEQVLALAPRRLPHGLGPGGPGGFVPWLLRQQIRRRVGESRVFDARLDRALDHLVPDERVLSAFDVPPHGHPEFLSEVRCPLICQPGSYGFVR